MKSPCLCEASFDVLAGTIVARGRIVVLSGAESALLTVLAGRRAGFSRDELHEMLWAHTSREAAAASLKVIVCRLRTKICRCVVETLGSGYAIACAVDGALEPIETELWRGRERTRALSPVEIDMWRERRARLRHRRVRAPRITRPRPIEFDYRFANIECSILDLLSSDARRRLDHGAALEYARESLYLDPLDENAAQIVIESLSLLGRPNAAIAVRESFSRLANDADAADLGANHHQDLAV